MELKRWLRAQWDRVAAVASVTIGAVALLIGYFGVRDALYPGEQIPYVISGGLFGLFAVGLGAALWLSADLRDEWRKLDEMDEKLTAVLAGVQHPTPAATVAETPATDTTLTAAGSSRASTNGRRRPVRAVG